MKRMAFLTALALVFSLFTVTAALASPGGHDGSENGDHAKVMVHDGACHDGDSTCACETDGSECEAAGDQTRTRTQDQTRTHTQDGTCGNDGSTCACETEGSECEAAGDQTRTCTQDQTKTHTQDGSCMNDDMESECTHTGSATMTRTRQMFIAELAAMNGEGSECGYRFGQMIRMWARANGDSHVPCIL